MPNTLTSALLLSILNYGITIAVASSDENFFQNCPASRCSEGGPEIRFPFRLHTSSPSCGAPGMEVLCSEQGDTILDHPNLGFCKVTSIMYTAALIDVIPIADSKCPLQNIISTNLSTKVYTPDGSDLAALVSCARELRTNCLVGVAGPISCLSNRSQLSYLVSSFQSMDALPLDCMVVSNGIWIPLQFKNTDLDLDFNETAKGIITFGETTLRWSVPNISRVCQYCENGGGHCGFRTKTRQPFCRNHSSHVKVIAATSSVGTVLVLSIIVAAVLYLALKSKNDEEIHLKVEMFLSTYSTSKPTRYTFSEVKKITKRFNSTLGQGGFGSVYKGELSNGVPVAVKILENTKGEGEEFINEVATIGTIHHGNIVRLLGFCSEGSRRALIYEFMPNESLEKYICSQESDTHKEELTPNTMLKIATGIAKGIEYLHQGCNQRILHFDIKPSNILLDYSFKPKISDFGLAKLCAKDQSIVTLTAARGTMGYIAPELYSRNFGTISYKSDVYSFGMVVLEMVSARMRLNPMMQNQNEVYIPEWIYKKIVMGQELEMTREMAQVEKEVTRKLAIVALWCIQWNPANRPSMAKVVNMLTDSLPNLKVPPKPFVSSLQHQT